MIPYRCAARAITFGIGDSGSASTFRVGSRRSRAPSGMQLLGLPSLPSERCAGDTNQAEQASGTDAATAWGMYPAAISDARMRPAATGMLVPVAPQLQPSL